jgi:uncharacterized cofD-like protein
MISSDKQKNRFKNLVSNFRRWLKPGIGVKRWLLMILVGITLLAFGVAVLVIDFYRSTESTFWTQLLSFLSLRFFDRPLRALIFGGLGLLFVALGTIELNRSLLKPFVKPGEAILDTIASYRIKEKGPKIVTIGGGTGLSVLLRGLKYFTHNLTALVTVTDDGGSSGELRKSLGILPPGDIRACLAALSDDEDLLTQLFQYRFGKSAGINGHSLGNLLISALSDITGSFEDAVAESGKVLAIRGRVLPSTLHDVKLVADVLLPAKNEEEKVVGESRIAKMGGVIRRVWLEPNSPSPYPPAIQAILSADLIIIGPGSLYTSVMPNLLVPELANALRVSKALKFYICNVANQKGETDGYKVLDHIKAIEKHLRDQHMDVIVCNNDFNRKIPAGTEWVMADAELEEQYSVYYAPLADQDNPWRHDSRKLAEVVMDLFYERTGPLQSRTSVKE